VVTGNKDLADQRMSRSFVESEAARLARSVRRRKARALRNNRAVALRLARAARA
jgi:hypothetical protein